jgi:mono/diheme cytochrome c family protein
MKPIRFSILLALSLAALILGGCNFSLAADVTPPPGYQPPPPAESTTEAAGGQMFPVVPPDPLQGAATYVEKCAPCHGVSGMGDGPNAATLPNPVAALGDPELAQNSTPSEWFSIVSNGNLDRFMPPFHSLSDRQRWDVVAYSFMLSNPPDELRHGAEVYDAECAVCHGPGGAGDGPQAAGMNVPDLTEQERMAGR